MYFYTKCHRHLERRSVIKESVVGGSADLSWKREIVQSKKKERIQKVCIEPMREWKNARGIRAYKEKRKMRVAKGLCILDKRSSNTSSRKGELRNSKVTKSTVRSVVNGTH